jgi:hypothetical protein
MNNLQNIANKFQVEKLEERTEFYSKIKTTIKYNDWEWSWEFESKANPGSNNDHEMPDLTVFKGIERVGEENFVFKATDGMNISIDGIK